jgi:polyisoprenoid-binding protein YceI
MKKIINTLILALFFTLSFAGKPAKTETYTVNTTESTIKWNAEKVTGTHFGMVTLTSGTLEMNDEKLVGGMFEVDMQSITVDDLDGVWKTKLQNHLKSDDFFGAETFPKATLKITDVKPLEDGKYKVGGILTIKEKSNRIEFETTIIEKGGSITATADLEIDRSKYDVKYGSGSFFDDLGDKTIYDNFILNVKLVAKN